MKTSDVLDEYKPQQVLAALQLERYRRDFAYFAENNLKVVPKYVSESGLVPFILNPPQRKVLEIIEAQKRRDGWIRLCVLKARQPGCSTLISGLAYQLTSLTPHTNARIYAQDDETSEHILKIVQRFYDNTPEAYKPRLYGKPAGGIDFCDPDSPIGYRERRIGSSISCQTARTALSGTGKTLHFVQLSECAKYPHPEDLWESLNPAIPDMPGTAVVLESTAHHMGAWFRHRCDLAKNDPDFPYLFIFTPWFWSPEYALPLAPGEALKLTLDEKQRMREHGLTLEQIKWYRYKLKSFGDDDLARERMKQEYPETEEEAWIDLNTSVFDRIKLQNVLAKQIRHPVALCDILPNGRIVDSAMGLLSIWEHPEPNEQYDIGADVASGQEGDAFDWSVASVVRRKDRTQVAEWRGKIDPIEYGSLLYHLGMYYNQAQVAVETNGIGYSTNTQLHKLGYPRVYIWRTRGEAVEKFTNRTGWSTSADSKSYLVSVIRHYIANNKLTIRSNVLLGEMKTFVQDMTPSGVIVYGAQAGCFDDAVMAYMIAVITGDDERLGDDFVAEQERSKPVSDGYLDPGLIDNFEAFRHPSDDALANLADVLGMRG